MKNRVFAILEIEFLLKIEFSDFWQDRVFGKTLKKKPAPTSRQSPWALILEQNMFSKQSTTVKNIATYKISSNLSHWFKSNGH